MRATERETCWSSTGWRSWGRKVRAIRTRIRELIGWPKLPAATDQYVLPLLSLPGLM